MPICAHLLRAQIFQIDFIVTRLVRNAKSVKYAGGVGFHDSRAASAALATPQADETSVFSRFTWQASRLEMLLTLPNARRAWYSMLGSSVFPPLINEVNHDKHFPLDSSRLSPHSAAAAAIPAFIPGSALGLDGAARPAKPCPRGRDRLRRPFAVDPRRGRRQGIPGRRGLRLPNREGRAVREGALRRQARGAPMPTSAR